MGHFFYLLGFNFLDWDLIETSWDFSNSEYGAPPTCFKLEMCSVQCEAGSAGRLNAMESLPRRAKLYTYYRLSTEWAGKGLTWLLWLNSGRKGTALKIKCLRLGKPRTYQGKVSFQTYLSFSVPSLVLDCRFLQSLHIIPLTNNRNIRGMFSMNFALCFSPDIYL